MPTTINEHIAVLSGADQSMPGNFTAEVYSSGERWWRALVPWLIAWLVAVVILPIPVVHLASIPLAVGGPIAAYFAYQRRHKTNRVTFVCPACRHDVEMSIDPHEMPPVYVYCPKCDAGLKIKSS